MSTSTSWAPKLEVEDVAEAHRALGGGGGKRANPALERLGGGARGDLSEEVQPDDLVAVEPGQARFREVVPLDVAGLVQADDAEREPIERFVAQLVEAADVDVGPRAGGIAFRRLFKLRQRHHRDLREAWMSPGRGRSQAAPNRQTKRAP